MSQVSRCRPVTQARLFGCVDQHSTVVDATTLSKTNPPEWVEGNGILTSADGYLSFEMYKVSNTGSTPVMDKRDALCRKRKELFFGLNGHSRHTLEEANEIVRDEWKSYNKSRGPISRFLRPSHSDDP